MRLLLDTHLLIWASGASQKLPPTAADLLSDVQSQLFFSAASLWEITIKFALGKPDFNMNPVDLRAVLRTGGLRELPVTSDHVLAVSDLPPIHKDPFDRLIVAQAIVEHLTLLTADKVLASYPGSIQKV
jgi:PIN domain nuclease of toxin-antitoxin system